MTLVVGLTPPPGRAKNLGYTPRVAAAHEWVEGVSDEHSRVLTAVPRDAVESGRRSATLTRRAVHAAIDDVSGSTHRIAGSLSKLAANQAGIGGRVNGLFGRYVVYGAQQLRWSNAALGGATTLADAASEVDDPDMELALLRLTGPRLQAAMFGSLLLAAWLDFLNTSQLSSQVPPARDTLETRSCTVLPSPRSTR
ncbi:hypothetical protein JRI60_27360 [Archangium violaceum]|uniref:hypothetical protein n=1 Tax=Archangium violaceum TaxID=83451 RepID=UPI001952645E|nr:hypothetical protein [Archangium violaceum]QRN92929.1 hypothetical protein JRI60_27360 [Archangium violaceum]